VKIMTVCGFGVGTSLLLKMTVDSILEEEGINGEVEASDMTSACGNSADLILTSKRNWRRDRRTSKWKTCLYIKLYG